MNPLISVIIPTYNSALTIKAALDSVCMQEYQGKEVFIIDGCSKDDTIEICKVYAEKYPFIKWISEKDNGTYDAMNKGIKLCKGDWLYFMGSDDCLSHERVFQAVSDVIKRSKNQVIYGNAKIIGGTAWAKDGELYAGEFDLKKLLAQNICHQAIFYNRQVFETVGLYNTRYSICADWDLNLHCFARFKFKYINETISNYSGGGASNDAVDVNFTNEKLYNVATYFKNKLYLRPFVKYRTAFRKMIFEKGTSLNMLERARLLFFSIILKLQTEQ